jgi:excisionase family DNA binding protein
MVKRLLSPRDVARRFGVTTSAVQAWDRAGRLRAVRDSAGRRLFEESAVRRFAKSRARRFKVQGASVHSSTPEVTGP